MNRFYRIFIVTVLILIACALAGGQVIEALRDAGMPPALPYGLSGLGLPTL